MNPLSSSLRREWRVAFSLRAQPFWFRVAKWTVFLGLAVVFWRQPFFWWCVLAAAGLGLGLHLFYRWKTRAWTRAWGGWNDFEAGRPRP
jgi:hypothetical protein